jgi:hypothetical protein
VIVHCGNKSFERFSRSHRAGFIGHIVILAK